jgi:hypothetical protein
MAEPCPMTLHLGFWDQHRSDICSEGKLFKPWCAALPEADKNKARMLRRRWMNGKRNRGRGRRGDPKPKARKNMAEAKKYVRKVAWEASVFTDTHRKVVYPESKPFLDGWPIDVVDAALEAARDLHLEGDIPSWTVYSATVKDILDIQ